MNRILENIEIYGYSEFFQRSVSYTDREMLFRIEVSFDFNSPSLLRDIRKKKKKKNTKKNPLNLFHFSLRIEHRAPHKIISNGKGENATDKQLGATHSERETRLRAAYIFKKLGEDDFGRFFRLTMGEPREKDQLFFATVS